MPGISVRKLYQDNENKLQFAWAAGSSSADNRISVDGDRPVLALVGHLNFIHPNRIQVLGLAEHEFICKMEEGEDTRMTLDELLRLDVALIIVANDLPVPYILRDFCGKNNIPLVTSKIESPYVMDVLRIYLQRALATSTVMHGVFLDVFEVGVFLMGQSGLGKSELALELISRGHALVADDAVELYRTAPESLEGRCPKVLRDFLEVRGLGVLNIRTIFGETAVRPNKQLKLIINLVHADDSFMKSLERLSMQTEKQEILNVGIRKITIPVAVGRNLAVLVESAVQNFILQTRGIDSTRDFLDRHKDAMKEDYLENEIDLD